MAHDTRTDDQKAKNCEKTLSILAQIRLPYEPMIDNIITYVNHSRRKIVDKDQTKGLRTGVEVYDGTALGAKNLLVDGLCGYTVSRNLRWLGFTLPNKLNFPRTSGMRRWSGKRMDEYPEVREYLDDCQDVMYGSFNRSNFYDQIPEYVGDCATAGTAHILNEEDIGAGRIIFTVPHFRECYISENHYGMVDTNYRIYKLTLQQLSDKFGFEKMKGLDLNFENAHKNNRYEGREIIHAIYPRKDYDSSKLNGKNKPIVSLWVLRSPLKLIEENGYDENPAITWRWRKNSDERYGYSPAWDAFVQILSANAQGKSNLIAGQKMVEGPMVAPSDLKGRINAAPKGYTWVDSMERQMPKPLQENIQLPYSVEQQDRLANAIKEHFHVNFWLMLYQAAFNKVQLTATQVVGMQGEQAAVIGMRVGRMESEALNPIIDRVFSIEDRAGRMPVPPQTILDTGETHIEVDFLGPLSQAQRKHFILQSINTGIEALERISQVYPQTTDKVDPDMLVDVVFDACNFPAKVIRNDEAVKQIRKIRQQERELEKTIQGVGEIAKAAQRTTKTVEPGSMMDMMTGGEKQPEAEA